MIAVDTQILVYAARADSTWHREALRLVIDLGESGAPWAIAWPCVHEFIRTLTHPRLYNPPASLADAFEAIARWRQSPTLAFIGEGPDHFEVLRQLATRSRVVGTRIHDARIAAICTENGVSELWTADRDLSAFRGLRARNPLA